MPVLPSEPVRRARRMAQSEWYAWWRRAPVAEDTVLWASLDGPGMAGHPRAVFDALVDDPRFTHLRHVWTVGGDRHSRAAGRSLVDHPRVSAAVVGSPAHFRALATAKYLVNDAAFPSYFAKRPGQVYLNTGRGMALQPVGYDAPEGGLGAANLVRNLLQADYLLSSGPSMTRSLYAEAYRLANIYPGTILEVGSPRSDVQFDPHASERLRALLARHGVAPIADRVALVLQPQPMGGPASGPAVIAHLADCLTTLRRALGPRWTVLVAMEPPVDPAVGDAAALRGALLPDSVSPNLVLGVADLLVSGPSSLIVDYLPRDRPMILMAPLGEQGGYAGSPRLAPEELPGPVAGDSAELAEAAARVAEGQDPHAAARRRWMSRHSPIADGRARSRVIDIVFGGSPDPSVQRILEPDGRTRLLLYLGGMARNGITSSALSLLHNIDHDRVDVTCFILDPSSPESLRSAREIDPRVRILLRSGGFATTRASYVRARALYTGILGDPADPPPGVRAVFDDEWARCFGSATFDRIADFSAYGAMWGLILLAGPAPLHGIWLHNEMLADSQRIVGGRRPLAKRLHAVFALYGHMDRLVSVSPALRDVNRAQLARFAAPEKFVYARNSVDFDRIDQMAQAPLPADDEAAHAVMQWIVARQDRVLFVTAGRLSSEKNHERLIRAFAEVQRTDPGTALVILGDGVLRGHLEGLVRELGLGGSCLIAGFQPNPFQFMRNCQCFVLSSDHEGQPMVILEALHLGLQVITTRFSSVDSALPEGVGLVVDQDVGALAEGMREYLRRAPGPVGFDSDAYNLQAMGEFYEALAIPPVGG